MLHFWFWCNVLVASFPTDMQVTNFGFPRMRSPTWIKCLGAIVPEDEVVFPITANISDTNRIWYSAMGSHRRMLPFLTHRHMLLVGELQGLLHRDGVAPAKEF